MGQYLQWLHKGTRNTGTAAQDRGQAGEDGGGGGWHARGHTEQELLQDLSAPFFRCEPAEGLHSEGCRDRGAAHARNGLSGGPRTPGKPSVTLPHCPATDTHRDAENGNRSTDANTNTHRNTTQMQPQATQMQTETHTDTRMQAQRHEQTHNANANPNLRKPKSSYLCNTHTNTNIYPTKTQIKLQIHKIYTLPDTNAIKNRNTHTDRSRYTNTNATAVKYTQTNRNMHMAQQSHTHGTSLRETEEGEQREGGHLTSSFL